MRRPLPRFHPLRTVYEYIPLPPIVLCVVPVIAPQGSSLPRLEAHLNARCSSVSDEHNALTWARRRDSDTNNNAMSRRSLRLNLDLGADVSRSSCAHLKLGHRRKTHQTSSRSCSAGRNFLSRRSMFSYLVLPRTARRKRHIHNAISDRVHLHGLLGSSDWSSPAVDSGRVACRCLHGRVAIAFPPSGPFQRGARMVGEASLPGTTRRSFLEQKGGHREPRRPRRYLA